MYRGREPTDSEIDMRDYSTMEADLIVIDESNSFSESRRKDRQYLTVVCSRTSDYSRFEKISDSIPTVKGVRKKYWNLRPPEVAKVVQDIEKFTETELIITEEHKYIRYENLEDPDSKADFYFSVLQNAIENSIRIRPDRAMIIILDTPPVDIYDRLWELGERLHTVYPNITWFETRISSGTRVLQSQDIITGLVADDVEGKDRNKDSFGRLKRYLRR